MPSVNRLLGLDGSSGWEDDDDMLLVISSFVCGEESSNYR